MELLTDIVLVLIALFTLVSAVCWFRADVRRRAWILMGLDLVVMALCGAAILAPLARLVL